MYREKLLNFFVVAYWTIAILGSVMFAWFFPSQFFVLILVLVLFAIISG